MNLSLKLQGPLAGSQRNTAPFLPGHCRESGVGFHCVFHPAVGIAKPLAGCLCGRWCRRERGQSREPGTGPNLGNQQTGFPEYRCRWLVHTSAGSIVPHCHLVMPAPNIEGLGHRMWVPTRLTSRAVPHL